jgi:AraC family ethanolamine operon transcriptional activator
MRTFDDFDAWGEVINGAHLRLTCDAVEQRRWTIGILDLGRVTLQVASEGGGNLAYGANTHDGPILFVPLSHSGEHVANGRALDEDSLLAIPRGADFSIRVRRRAHAWCSIALPADAPIAAELPSGSVRLSCRPGSVGALGRRAQQIAAALLGRPGGTQARHAAAEELLDAVNACLPGTQPPRTTVGRPRADRAEIIRRSMEVIEATPTMPQAAEIARRIGVNDRTLLRTFQETFGVPTKRYLLLRELHRVRTALNEGAPAEATLADVLARHGIWEFGRFAGRYRRHFGELPSETLRRARA